jgi:hypothetical protein
MGLRTLGLLLATLCLATSAVAHDMATNSSSASGSGSGSETVAELLAVVQAAVADDPALANMFDISSASQMSEEELTTLLQDILSVSLSGSGSISASESASDSTSGSAEATQSASAAGSTVSGANKMAQVSALALLVALGALCAAL